MEGSRAKKRLLDALFRAKDQPMITDEELALYWDRRLAPEEAGQVERRLAEHPWGPEVLSVLARMNQLDESGWELPRPALQRRVIAAYPDKAPLSGDRLLEIVIELARDCIHILKETADEVRFYNSARQEVRGGEGPVPGNLVLFWKTFDTLQTEIEVERIAPGRNEISFKAVHAQTGLPAAGVRVHFFEGSSLRESQMVVDGRAVFENVAFGDYRFTLERHESTLGQITLSMRGEAA